jgi:hypothetical protein
MTIQKRIDSLQEQIAELEMVRDAYEQQTSPYREWVVVKINGEYIATPRYEVNPDNGWVTVQLKDGSVLPTRPGHWSLQSRAEEYLDIFSWQIKYDME